MAQRKSSFLTIKLRSSLVVYHQNIPKDCAQSCTELNYLQTDERQPPPTTALDLIPIDFYSFLLPSATLPGFLCYLSCNIRVSKANSPPSEFLHEIYIKIQKRAYFRFHFMASRGTYEIVKSDKRSLFPLEKKKNSDADWRVRGGLGRYSILLLMCLS